MNGRMHTTARPEIAGRPIAVPHVDARNPARQKAAAAMGEDRRKDLRIEERRQPCNSLSVTRCAKTPRLQNLTVGEGHPKGAPLTMRRRDRGDLPHLHHRDTDGVDERPQVEAELDRKCLTLRRGRLQAAIRNTARVGCAALACPRTIASSRWNPERCP